MKVTKRDGRVVDYDRNKIIVAIQKANAEVDRYEQVSEEKIDAIVAGIENKHVDNLQVEDIQDMIEQKLMNINMHLPRSILFIVIHVKWSVVRIRQMILL